MDYALVDVSEIFIAYFSGSKPTNHGARVCLSVHQAHSGKPLLVGAIN